MAHCLRCRAPEPEGVVPVRDSALLLRAWRDGEMLRCRLLAAGTDLTPSRTVAVAEGADEISAAVRRWLDQL